MPSAERQEKTGLVPDNSMDRAIPNPKGGRRETGVLHDVRG